MAQGVSGYAPLLRPALMPGLSALSFQSSTSAAVPAQTLEGPTLRAMGNSPTKSFGDAAAAVLQKEVKPAGEAKEETAYFAAGCFWGVELSFQRVPGVKSTRVGYINGQDLGGRGPTYEEVCTGKTGYAEAVEVVFDPSLVSYRELLTVLWDRHNPTTLNRQGNDVGTQYRSGIYYVSPAQQQAAEASKAEEQARRVEPIVTEIVPADKFFAAEDYHQSYLAKGGQCSRKGDLTPIRCYG